MRLACGQARRAFRRRRASLDAGGWRLGAAAVAFAAAGLPGAAPGADTIAILHPIEDAVFPREFTAPDFLWEDDTPARHWLLMFRFSSGAHEIRAVSDGVRPAPVIDDRCRRDSDEPDAPDRVASARGWRPSADVWRAIQRASLDQRCALTIRGFVSPPTGTGDPPHVSEGTVSFRTSADPVGAELFYRDVPLMPARTLHGVIQPLRPEAIPLIQWRIRDVAQPASRVVLEAMPTCANCHSFSQDGRRFSMDVDGPDGDKGAHTVVAVRGRMSIEREDVFSWNRASRDKTGAPSSGLFPRLSPDGRYVAATVAEEVYVQNYMDWRFLQTFYPTRGRIGIYDTATGEMFLLPGADDPAFVQSNPVWSPDGREIVFIRAIARDSYESGPPARFANDSRETQIRYDLYRIPFNGGKGGTATPIVGASKNGRSNSFPAFSPDGRWIVFVQAENGLLMRPDSALYIIPAQGGEARRMTCNLEPMNSWHTWSPNGRWLAFSSKAFGYHTKLLLAHVGEDGRDSPPVLLPDSTAANRAVNLPEFVPAASARIEAIEVPAVDYRRLSRKGMDLAQSGDLQTAGRLLRESLALKEDYPDTHIALGYVQDGLGRFDEAVASFQRALEIEPRHPRAHRYYAMTLNKRGRPAEAIEHVRQAIAGDPRDDEAYRLWGDALANAGRLQEAETLYRKALSLNDRNAFAHNNLAMAIAASGRWEESLRHYDMAIESAPSLVSAHANRGMVLLRLGRGAEAAVSFRAAIGLEPGHVPALRGLALVLASDPSDKVRDGRESLRLARTACELTGHRDGLCLLALAAAHAENGDYASAVRAAEAALAALPDSSPTAGDIRARVLPAFRSRQPMRTAPAVP